jgi:hypothetical protein
MTKQEIKNKLIDNHKIFTDYIISLSEADFLFSFQNKWTAGQQIGHVCRTTSPLLLALAIPKMFAKLLFGKLKRSLKGYDSLVQEYLLKLQNGAKASVIYIPKKIDFHERSKFSGKLLKTVAKIDKLIDKFSEKELDQIILPHPILGKLTIREMLYFTIYHVQHHHNLAKKNLSQKNINSKLVT